MYTFATVRPLAESQRSSSGSPLAAGSSPEQFGRDDYFWKVVSLVPASELPTAASVASSRLIAAALISTPIARQGVVVGAVVAFQDITERKRDQEKIRKLAFFDPLTDLPNRRMLMDRLEHALAQARRHRRALAGMNS